MTLRAFDALRERWRVRSCRCSADYSQTVSLAAEGARVRFDFCGADDCGRWFAIADNQIFAHGWELTAKDVYRVAQHFHDAGKHELANQIEGLSRRGEFAPWRRKRTGRRRGR